MAQSYPNPILPGRIYPKIYPDFGLKYPIFYTFEVIKLFTNPLALSKTYVQTHDLMTSSEPIRTLPPFLVFYYTTRSNFLEPF